MGTIEWKNKIIKAIESVADGHFQAKAWFSTGDIISSPNEVYSELFDDYMFEEFLEAKIVTSEQNKKCRQLIVLMERFSDKYDIFMNPNDILNDPEWQEIRETATECLNLLNR